MKMWFEDLSFRRSLRNKLKSKERIWSEFHKDVKTARANKDWTEENAIAGQAFEEERMVDAEILSLQHSYITKQARQLLIPVPEFDKKTGDWIEDQFDGSWHLTPDILMKLGREVRQERRERLELVFLWPSSVVGLIGGIIGAASFFLK